jgi:hypothetical protein
MPSIGHCDVEIFDRAVEASAVDIADTEPSKLFGLHLSATAERTQLPEYLPCIYLLSMVARTARVGRE